MFPIDRHPDFVTLRWVCPTYDEARTLVEAVNAAGRERDGKFDGMRLVESSLVEWDDAGEEKFAVDVVLDGAGLFT